jgi:hypothetical protein
MVIMLLKYFKISILFVCILLSGISIPTSMAGNYQRDFNFKSQFGFLGQKLYVSVQPSLYYHYINLTHKVNSDSDYTNYITAQAVKPIAESLENATHDLPNSDEQFANSVLEIVHQIPYQITGVKYPVETLIDNSGDCVALSLLAASIMMAGGLDVVLIHYSGINPSHINVGVYLPNTPVYHNILTPATSFGYENKTYWTAEATPESDWKVGDQSEMLLNTISEIIPLNDTEQSSLGQVSCSLGNDLLSSSLSLNLLEQSPSVQNSTRGFVISGSLTPVFADQTIDIYINQNHSLAQCNQTQTDGLGNYSFSWNFTLIGTYYITTSWSGAQDYAGADSETPTVFVGPQSILQFGNLGYSYILEQTNFVYYLLGPAYTVNFTLPILQGVGHFLTVSLETNLSLSYNFILLQTGHEAQNYSSKTINIPDSEQSMTVGRNRLTRTIHIRGDTVTAPTSIPDGMGPLTVPSDFNQTINNQFCFQLQNNGLDNYSLNMDALDYYDIANLTQDTQSNTALLNATDNIKENTWYNVTQNILNNQITTRITDANGTLIDTMTTFSNNLTILIANNVDNAVVFKNLKYQNQVIPHQTPLSSPKTTLSDERYFQYLILAITLISGLSLVLLFLERKKSARNRA